MIRKLGMTSLMALVAVAMLAGCGSSSSSSSTSGSTGTNLWTEQYAPYGVKLNGVSEKLGYTGHVFDSRRSQPQ